MEARQKARPIEALPVDIAPKSVQQAYAIQDETIRLSGDVGGWKVAPRPNGGEFLCSPIPQAFFVPQDVRIERLDFLAPEAEIEIAIRFGRDLPPRSDSYPVEDVTDAIVSCHPAIEILSSRFHSRRAANQLSNIADLQSCGAVVVGNAYADWKSIEMSEVPITIAIDGRQAGTTPGGTSSHHVFAALTWLANHATSRNGGLKKGQTIITGARVGPVAVRSGERIVGTCGTIGEVRTVI
jgi:2-keto-4-pentenoate hydratase